MRRTKRPASTRPAAIRAQPAAPPPCPRSSRPPQIAAVAAAISPAPAQSIDRCSEPRDSGTNRSAASAATATIGSADQKMLRQPSVSSSTAPSRGLTASPAAVVPERTATACWKRSAGTIVVSSAQVAGCRSPAPAPCTARPAISAAEPCASEQTTAPAAKIANPQRNSRRRPKRSPSAPPGSASAA